MQAHLIILFFGFFLIYPICGDLLTEWDQYWPTVCDGQVDLFRPDHWKRFLQMGEHRFGSPLFDPDTSPSAFVDRVLGEIVRGNTSMKGLYTAKQILQYYPDLHAAPTASTKYQLEKAYKGQSFEEWSGKVSPLADAMIILRNLNLATPHDYTTASHISTFLFRENVLDEDGMECSLQGFGPNSPLLTVKTLASYLGDGAINGEVDEDVRPLEGHSTAVTACVMANLLHRLASKEGLGFNKDDITRDVKLFQQAAATERFMNICRRIGNGEELFEATLLERLRALNVNTQILLSIGFTGHAMAMAIKRTSPFYYELLIFNSGSGIQYHDSSVSGTKRKVFPAKRFSNLTLLRLKWSLVLQRLYHVTMVGVPIAGNKKASTVEDLYVTALAGLQDLERPFTEADMDRYRLFVAQRSGTCNVEVLMAFLSHDKKRPYQKLKIFLYKDLLELAFQKTTNDKEWATMKRLLKYGLENHARTVLRSRRLNGDQGENGGDIHLIPLKHMIPEGLWDKYAQVKDAYIYANSTEFNVKTENLVRNSKFYFELLDDAGYHHSLMNEALNAKKAFHLNFLGNCRGHAALIFDPLYIGMRWIRFTDYLEAIVGYMTHCRLRADDYETAVFLSLTVLNKWPDPDDVEWKTILGRENKYHEKHLESLWLFAKQILTFQHKSGYSGIYVYTALHKIMMIFQYALDEFLPGMANCSVTTPFYMDASAHYCFSHDITAYFERLSAKPRESCFTENMLHPLPTGPLLTHLERLGKALMNEYTDFNFRDVPKAVLLERRSTGDNTIPIGLYYWNALRDAVTMMEYTSISGWNFSFPRMVDPRYLPTENIASMSDLSRGLSKFGQYTESNFVNQLAVLDVARDERDWSKIDQVYPDTKQRLATTVLSSNYDQFGRFVHLLRVEPDEFDWTITLHLGALVVHRPQPLSTIVNAVSILNELIDGFRNDLHLNKDQMASSAAMNPDLKRKVEHYAALIIIESIVARKNNNLTNSKRHLADLKSILDKNHIHRSYKVFFAFAFLASIPHEPTLDEAEYAIILNKEFKGDMQIHLKDDCQRYRDHLLANVMNAFYVIAKSSDRKSIIGGIIGNSKGKLVDQKFISTTQETDANYFVDLVSGVEFSQGFNAVAISPDILTQYYREAEVFETLENFNFTSAKQIFFAEGFLIRCDIVRGSRSFKKGSLHYELVSLDIRVKESPQTPKTISIREGYEITGEGIKERRYAIRLSHEKFNLPIPAKLELGKPYQILAFVDDKEFAILGPSETIWINDKQQLTFPGTMLTNLTSMAFESRSDFASPLAGIEEAFCFVGEDKKLRLLLSNYADSGGNPLWLIQADGGHWGLLSESKFQVSSSQYFSTAGMLPKYLLVEGQQKNFKLVLPEEHHQINAHGDKVEKEETIRKRCLSISLARATKKYKEDEYRQKLKMGQQNDITAPSLVPHPKSRQESLLLLYNYLTTRHYHEAMKEADNIHQMERFNDEESRLLGWIAKSHVDMRNGSPESIAIRGFICFHVFNNAMLFHSFGETVQNFAYDGPYMTPSKWSKFWSAEHLNIAAEVIAQYVNRLTKIPIFLRFDPEASFPRVGPTQWTTWVVKLLDHSRSYDLNHYLFRTEGRYFERSIRFEGIGKVEKFEDPKDVVQKMSDQKEMTAPVEFKTLLEKPIELIKMKNLLMAKIISGTLDPDTAEKLDQWLQAFERIPDFSLVAKTLRKALLMNSSSLPQDKTQVIKWLIITQDANHSPSLGANIESALPRTKRTFSQKSLYADIRNFRIHDNLYGIRLPLEDIKRQICSENDLDSILNPIVATVARYLHISESRIQNFGISKKLTNASQKLMLVQKFMKLYKLHLFHSFDSLANQYGDGDDDVEITTRLKDIGYGKVSITAADIIHMYAKAQSNYYLQYFPHFTGKVEELHRIATEFVLAHSNWQDVKRLRKVYASNHSKPGICAPDATKIELELYNRTRSTDTTMNNMLAYECYINSRLTKEQTRKIIELTTIDPKTGKYPDVFVQWIMSAGKTYILGTLLSVMKADHKHLSILVVPKSLLTGEAANLFSRTIAAFNRDGFSFHLARDPKLADLSTIKWIKEAIINAITRGRYVILTADLLESLHDKFVELGKERKNDLYEEMRQLLSLIHDNGAMTVDEAHKIFDPIQETNFPLASSKGNSSDNSMFALEARALAEVFKFVAEDKVLTPSFALNNSLDPGQGKKIRFLIGAHLVESLSKQDQSLFSFLEPSDLSALKFFQHFTKDDLFTFITKDSEHITDAEIQKIRIKASPDLYRVLAVCRFSITSLIPLAWSGNVNEHYGLEPGKKYAVPFSAAFAPKIGSEFAFRWYGYARTIRTYLVKGFDEMTIKWALAWLQKWALKEFSAEKGSKIPGDIVQIFFELNSPYEIDLQSNEQIEHILKRCNGYHRYFIDGSTASSADEKFAFSLYSEFLFRWIAEDVLPSIDYYAEQISTNSQDISYMVSSRQLYSGSVITPLGIHEDRLDGLLGLRLCQHAVVHPEPRAAQRGGSLEHHFDCQVV